MGIISYGKSDIGRKRSTNQDRIYYNNDLHLYIVADGMGGHNGGDTAAQIAVDTIPEYITPRKGKKESLELLKEAVLEANFKIFQTALKRPELKGMGTTVVLLYFEGNQLYIGNVGDSRAYLIKENQIYQLGRDHSLIQEKINLGLYTREQAAEDQMKNVLVRAVGHDEQVLPEFFTFSATRNDLFLICSDGLHGKLNNLEILNTIQETLQSQEGNVQSQVEKAVENLINKANENGGNDNISVIISYAI